MWENLGWHYEAISPRGRISAYPNLYCGKVQGYTAMLHEPDGSGHPTYLGEPGHGRTPKAAVASLIRNVKEHMKHIQSLIEGL